MNLKPRQAAYAFQGITLLVVCLVLYGLLVPTTSCRGPASRHSARTTRQGLEVANLAQAVEAFNVQWRSYPPDFSNDDISDARSIDFVFEDRKRGQESVPEFTPPNVEPTNLDPSEALVFWLGGEVHRNLKEKLHDSPDAALPFFEFDQSRLRDVDNDGHLEYYPPDQESPYVYLRVEESQKLNENGVPSRRATLNGQLQIRPYVVTFEGRPKEISYQILCAGRDDAFGSGGVYPDGVGYSKADMDNFANFSFGRRLKDCIP